MIICIGRLSCDHLHHLSLSPISIMITYIIIVFIMNINGFLSPSSSASWLYPLCSSSSIHHPLSIIYLSSILHPSSIHHLSIILYPSSSASWLYPLCSSLMTNQIFMVLCPTTYTLHHAVHHAVHHALALFTMLSITSYLSTFARISFYLLILSPITVSPLFDSI